MAVARDAFTDNSPASTNPLTLSHTPAGTPRGVVVIVCQDSGTADALTATYGGVSMTLVRTVDGTANAEPGVVYIFFLGSSVPTGTQTVSVSGNTTSKNISCWTVTAAADTEVETSNEVVSGSLDDPSFTLSTGSGVECIGFAGIFSGLGTVSNVTAGSGWTKEGTGRGFTGQVNAVEYLTANDAGDGFTCAFTTAGPDDVTMGGIAIKESAGVTTSLIWAQPPAVLRL